MHSGIRERYYRCYFMKDDRIVGYQNVFSHDDDGAIDKAREILRDESQRTIELWRGKERVAVLEKDNFLAC